MYHILLGMQNTTSKSPIPDIQIQILSASDRRLTPSRLNIISGDKKYHFNIILIIIILMLFIMHLDIISNIILILLASALGDINKICECSEQELQGLLSVSFVSYRWLEGYHMLHMPRLCLNPPTLNSKAAYNTISAVSFISIVAMTGWNVGVRMDYYQVCSRKVLFLGHYFSSDVPKDVLVKDISDNDHSEWSRDLSRDHFHNDFFVDPFITPFPSSSIFHTLYRSLTSHSHIIWLFRLESICLK